MNAHPTVHRGQLRYRFGLTPAQGNEGCGRFWQTCAVQRFECLLSTSQIVDLQRKLKKLVGRDDSLRFYFISADDVKRITLLGGADVTTDRNFILH